MFELSEQKQQLLQTNGNLIILGGPGSGKTTIALLKARKIVLDQVLKSGQKVLFLSFARATVARVEEQLKGLKISNIEKRQIDINTYHGFTWEILKSHGYLLNGIKRIKLLPPPEAASRFAEYTNTDELQKEKHRLFLEEGLLHFDLFAEFCADLFENSQVLTNIFCDSYPVIILDEFQDTNLSEWKLIKRLGASSQIIALADAEQRIYEFRGADPKRIKEYIDFFKPTVFDFGIENNRSNGTDIVRFGNELLSGKLQANYNDVSIINYPFLKGNNHLPMKQSVLLSIARLNKKSSDWSLAILVPTKQLMLQVSDCLSEKQEFKSKRILPKIEHDVALEKEALALSAVLIAGLMEKGEADLVITNRLINHLIDYIRGRKGSGKITKKDLALSIALKQYIEMGKIRGGTRINTLNECIRISHLCSKLEFTGNPARDWITVRDILFSSASVEIKQLAIDSLYLRLLHKGSLLQSGLSNIWREKNGYEGAINLVRNALLQEHFSNVKITHRGIQVMTIHKAKGKEFEEVIIYEGVFNSRLVRDKDDEKEMYKSRLLLRVAVTRAMQHTTILTPAMDRCILLN
jgi:DNA helicase II / ATP-dependent DNA helicase PcrA